MCCALLESELLGCPTCVSVTAEAHSWKAEGPPRARCDSGSISGRALMQVSTTAWSLRFLLREGGPAGLCIPSAWPCCV